MNEITLNNWDSVSKECEMDAHGWFLSNLHRVQTISFEVSRNLYNYVYYVLILDTNHLTTLVEVQSW